MAITTVDYQVLRDDSSFTLPNFNNGLVREETLIFNPPDDIVLNGTGRDRPVLTYFIDPSNDAKNVKLQVFVREKTGVDQKISDWNLTGTLSRSVSEPFHHEKLSKGDNKIIFRVPEQGAGNVKISNVIVWFKRKP